LVDADALVANQDIGKFKQGYDALVKAYNDSSETRAGLTTGTALFLTKRDALVQATRDALNTSLSPSGAAAFEQAVEKAKRGVHRVVTDTTVASADRPRFVYAAYDPQQYGCNISINYDSYLASALGNVNFHNPELTVYSEIVVEGYSSMNGMQCPPSVSHHSRIFNNFYVNGSPDSNPEFDGSSVSPSSWISDSYADTTTLDWLHPGSGTGEADIMCSFAGSVFSSTFNFQFEVAITLAQDTAQAGIFDPNTGKTFYQIVSFCSDTADWNPAQVLSGIGRHSYWLGVTVCLRYPGATGVPWICAAKIAEVLNNPSDALHYLSQAIPWVGTPQYHCTNYDLGYSGLPAGASWPF
jgi:hypothetical protein